MQEVPYNTAVVVLNMQWQISPRLDYALSANNTLVLRYNHTQSSNLSGVGGFTLPNQETQSYTKGNTVQITETSILGTKAVDETRFQFRDNPYSNVNNANGSPDVPGLNVNGAFMSGGAPLGIVNGLAANNTDTKGFELTNFVTLAEGNHVNASVCAQTDESILSTNKLQRQLHVQRAQHHHRGPSGMSGGHRHYRPDLLDIYQQTEVMLQAGDSIQSILQSGCGPSEFTLNSGITYWPVRQFDLGAYVQDDLALPSEPHHQHWRSLRNPKQYFGSPGFCAPLRFRLGAGSQRKQTVEDGHSRRIRHLLRPARRKQHAEHAPLQRLGGTKLHH